ncbi:hypothetical protein COLO4_32873 [Corchorus olitorius]|uniref:Uncharacterized protein n=1 Tax=Corchorus olitorius TaxID=93759 RepID=A0A1R3GXQ7_9ROSI|nr:hypothetical protein COLO4_32873 [Corchorus olitorius]
MEAVIRAPITTVNSFKAPKTTESAHLQAMKTPVPNKQLTHDPLI